MSFGLDRSIRKSIVVGLILFLCFSCEMNQLPDSVASAAKGDPGGGSTNDVTSATVSSGASGSADASGRMSFNVDSTDLSSVDWSADITISFSPWDGHFFLNSGQTQNPYKVTTKPGLIVAPPQPWKEGYRFVGWYVDYNTWQRQWDFSKDIVTENRELYAYFVKSDNPDPKPEKSVIAEAKLYDMGLTPHSFPELEQGGTKILWAAGVSETKGWTDNPQYTNNCWGTTASQMLDWYFRQPKNEGVLGRSNAPKDITATRTYFKNYWGEWPWMIDRALIKYFSDFFPALVDKPVTYMAPGGNNALSLDTLSALCYKHLSKGDVGGLMGLSLGVQPHAMTLWGAEFDSNGLVKALYLSTSECTTDEEVLKPRMNRYERYDYAEKGRYEWKTSFSLVSTTYGYESSFWTSMTDVYGLCFLSVSD